MGFAVARELMAERATVPSTTPLLSKPAQYPAVPAVGGAAFILIAALLSNCGSDGDGRPAEWAYISPVILQPNCATTSCHSRAQAAAGLDFSDPGRAYESLFGLEVWVVEPGATAGQAGCKVARGAVVCPRPMRAMVTPFNPGQSRLINMLRANGAARMPPDRPLPEADIRLIERWILDGAHFRPQPVDAGAAD
jgi:hypothetical protein